tara:strand:+ start:490 stop:840 length:351 start_codon:yes stop_codon:yes gene_type:complete
MKKCLLIIFSLCVFLNTNIHAHKLSKDHYHQIFCQGINEPDATFSISNKTIFYNKQMGFNRKWTMKKKVFKGEKIQKGSKWEIVIDARRGEAQMITTNYYKDLADDVFVRNWKNCK